MKNVYWLDRPADSHDRAICRSRFCVRICGKSSLSSGPTNSTVFCRFRWLFTAYPADTLQVVDVTFWPRGTPPTTLSARAATGKSASGKPGAAGQPRPCCALQEAPRRSPASAHPGHRDATLLAEKIATPPGVGEATSPSAASFPCKVPSSRRYSPAGQGHRQEVPG